ncbi:DUF1552 domain-containing protein [Rubinisphaera margarita]|uniref:DUF1552 domain-containing protein n=1 Tax=Rubinisphaera margarita TaxID=2909586 RepID=UPI001EE78C74|nr:DUF1552 domain-containing protein [Rubinisphaera margarita]MCG6155259.1 DUF1552 domain-containing protein [Rubinisphaera margarita]
MKRRVLDRRHFLRGTGAAVALPFLSAMEPAFAQATGRANPEGVHRFVAVCGSLGFHTPALFPEAEGKEYPLTPYLQHLADHRDRFTVFSGLSHPEQNGNNGHASMLTWLTSAQRPGLAGFKNTVSLDQLMAERLGGVTRLPYLSLSTNGESLSWTANGVSIPAEQSPSRLFKTLFITGSPREIEAELRELERGRSILDTVAGQARKLDRTLGPQDRAKLDEYLTSVRSLETRIGQTEQWTKRDKPAVNYEPPQDVADKQDILAKQRLMYDMMALALQTDSTRVMTFSLGGMNAVPSNIPGVSTDWHNLSHHGKDEEKIEELKIIEEHEFMAFGEFLTKIRGLTEAGRPLLDSTSILFGSNLGNASAHDWHNLPIIVAGGGYRHHGYVAHDAQNNTPLANLFVTFAQQMGIETDTFGSSTAAGIRGLETA